jgi:hypothetical protein
MTRNQKPVFGALLGLGLLASAGARALPANETLLPANTTSPASLTVGTWTVTFNPLPVNDCQLNLGSGATTNCNPVLATGTVDGHGDLSVTFTENAGGNILSLQSTTLEDLSVGSEVIATTGTQKITSATLTETGTAASGTTDSNFLTASELISVNASNVPGAALATNGVTVADTGSASTVSATAQFSPQSSLFVAKDIHATANVANSAGVTSVTQVFNVPEPASLSILAIGFAGLVGMRRRRAKA